MKRFLQGAVFVFVTTWIFFYVVTVLACQNGVESDLDALDKAVYEGIHNPVYYWSDNIAEQWLKGDSMARISFLEILVRPQDCSSNETFPLSRNEVQLKLRENYEQGFKITPAVCPPPAVKEWCDQSFFGMRSVYFRLKGDKTTYPSDVAASYCCLETNPIGAVIATLRENFDIFTFCGVFIFVMVITCYYFIRYHCYTPISNRLRRNRGSDDSGSSMEMEHMSQ